MITCPKCGNQAEDDAIFCDQCGTRLKVEAAPVAAAPAPAPVPAQVEAGAPAAAGAAEVICPSCGQSNVPGEMFCENCGTRLAAPEVAAAPAAATAPAPAGVEATSVARVCPACGATAAAGDTFCYACGADLSKGAEATPVTAVAPATEPAVAAPVAPVAPAALTCPSCGAEYAAGADFCEFCGAALPGGAAVTPVEPAQPMPATPVMALPRLVVAASGAELPLPDKAEVIVGREDPVTGVFPDVDLTPHGGDEGGVSRRHLRIVKQGNQYLAEDLNSTNGTLLNRKRLTPGAAEALQDGDSLRVGRVQLVFKLT